MQRRLLFGLARVVTLKALREPDLAQRFLREFETGDPLQLSKTYLSRLLDYARTESPFYRARISGGALAGVPLLTKEELRTNFTALQTPEALRLKAEVNTSGGSTGTPTRILQDRIYHHRGYATEAYYLRHFLGINPDCDKKVIIWGSQRDVLGQGTFKRRLANWLNYTTFINAYCAGESHWPQFAKILIRERPKLVRGYANALYLFCRWANENKVVLPAPVAVISSAETLQSEMRAVIESAFGAKVYDFYGSRETGPIAGECRCGNRHLFIFNNLVEVFNGHSAASDGEVGELAITALHNLSAPLIRYLIGDRGSITTASCRCGSALPVLKSLDGRVTDSLEASDGSIVDSGYFRSLLVPHQCVRQFQITQYEIDLVRIAVIGELPAPPERNKISQAICRALGDCCRVEWRLVDSLEVTAQGKLIPCRNLVTSSSAAVRTRY